MNDGTDDAPLVGVVIKHTTPTLLVSMEPDDTRPWVEIGWIAQENA